MAPALAHRLPRVRRVTRRRDLDDPILVDPQLLTTRHCPKEIQIFVSQRAIGGSQVIVGWIEPEKLIPLKGRIGIDVLAPPLTVRVGGP